MKKGIIFFFIGCLLFLVSPVRAVPESVSNGPHVSTTQVSKHPQKSDSHEKTASTESPKEEHHVPGWSVIPFVLLLLMIATGPLFYEHFWHKHYPTISMVLALIVTLYYLFGLGNYHGPVDAAFEYVQYIALLASLFIASGGIMIEVNKNAGPGANAILLIIGAVIANLIGTTGASMLLIRPFIRLNKEDVRPYHIIFFIFIVSNVGGSLTPIGDPPLFLGFLKGVPFFWTLEHNFLPWLVAILTLTLIFYLMDRAHVKHKLVEPVQYEGPSIRIHGKRNFIWLAIVLGSVFLDPNIFSWIPGIHLEGKEFSFIREVIMFLVAFLSYRFAKPIALEKNEFSFEPIREVAFIFVGIFFTMMPALDLVSAFAQSGEGRELITHNTLYWGTGILSGFLDNAPTYLNFLAAAMASQNGDISIVQQVTHFAQEIHFHDSALDLEAISIASVFFGAMTYIGNGPNFMVKSISEEVGIKMPSFFGYVIRYSIPILLPVLIIVWLIFFAFIPVPA